MLLPPGAKDPIAARAILWVLDGLVLTGGADVDPGRYLAERDPRTGDARADRDEWEIALARAALDSDLPVLAICRGMQVLNVALGGDLLQHLPDTVGNDDHCPVIGKHGRHEVTLSRGSRVSALLGDQATVATYHHQAVRLVPDELTPTGWAADGTIEAFEHRRAAWVVGVQWHPEAHDGAPLFQGFVSACASRCAHLAAIT